MKRLCLVVLSALLCLLVIGSCVAEEAILEASSEPVYLVSRPAINFRNQETNELFKQLTFGTQLKVIEQNGKYTTVEAPDGTVGIVSTGFIVPCYYPVIYIDSEGVWLSPVPGLEPSDFSYGACGLRWEEKALILFEESDYIFIVTEEGFSGYISKNDTHISLCTE